MLLLRQPPLPPLPPPSPASTPQRRRRLPPLFALPPPLQPQRMSPLEPLNLLPCPATCPSCRSWEAQWDEMQAAARIAAAGMRNDFMAETVSCPRLACVGRTGQLPTRRCRRGAAAPPSAAGPFPDVHPPLTACSRWRAPAGAHEAASARSVGKSTTK